MPYFSSAIQADLRTAVKAIQAGWSSCLLHSSTPLDDFFYSCALQDSPAFLYNFMKAYLITTPDLRLRFKSYIQDEILEERLNEATEIAEFMQEEHIFDEENFNVVINVVFYDLAIGHAKPWIAAQSLCNLNHVGILMPANRDVLVGHPNSFLVAQAICWLADKDLLTQDNLNTVAGHPAPAGIEYLLTNLHQTGILTAENRDSVARYEAPWHLDFVIDLLHQAGILTQDSFTALLNPAHQVLLHPHLREIMWDRLAANHLRDNWVRILEAAETQNPEEALRILTTQILGMGEVVGVGVNPGNAQINDRQSTHTASVHRSVSESATRLFERYGAQLDGLNLDTIITTINAWAHALPAGSVNDAAKRCFERLSAPHYTYSDVVSDVSTCQLLALSWLAIHDEANRQGSLSDALRQFSEGLYESQRGYNLSEQGVDEGGVDDPICTAGTFNKLVEKLEGIHLDVIIKHITPKIAGLKLPAVVKEEVNRYLTERTTPTTAAGFVSITARLKQIEDEGVSAIWDAIKENVSTSMFDEFGSLYTNKDNPQFTGLVDAGQYVNLGKLPSFQKALSESEGYREYCSVSMKSYGVFFKESREENDHQLQRLHRDLFMT